MIILPTDTEIFNPPNHNLLGMEVNLTWDGKNQNIHVFNTNTWEFNGLMHAGKHNLIKATTYALP